MIKDITVENQQVTEIIENCKLVWLRGDGVLSVYNQEGNLLLHVTGLSPLASRDELGSSPGCWIDVKAKNRHSVPFIL